MAENTVQFVDELPEGTPQRRTAWSPVVDQVKANPGKWARVREYTVDPAKLARKASELRSTLKDVAAKNGLEYEVRTPDGTLVHGFLRAPADA